MISLSSAKFVLRPDEPGKLLSLNTAYHYYTHILIRLIIFLTNFSKNNCKAGIMDFEVQADT